MVNTTLADEAWLSRNEAICNSGKSQSLFALKAKEKRQINGTARRPRDQSAHGWCRGRCGGEATRRDIERRKQEAAKLSGKLSNEALWRARLLRLSLQSNKS